MSSVGEVYEVLDELLMLEDMDEDEKRTQVFKDTFEAISGELEIGLENVGKWRTNLKVRSAGYKAEVDRLNARRKSIDNTIEWIDRNIEQIMRVAGKTKIQTDLFSFGIQKNPPSVQISSDVDIDSIPPEYIKFADPEIDKTKVKDALKAGEEFEWAQLVQTEGLRIR